MENKKKEASLNRRDFLVGSSLAGAGLLTAGTAGACSSQSKQSNRTKPLAPDFIERNTDDGGFSKGYFPHFSPSEELWVDCHVHFSQLTDRASLNHLLDEWFSRLDWSRLGKVVCITEQENMFEIFGETTNNDPRFAWMYWPKIDTPSLSKIRDAVSYGSCAIKMHNSPIITGVVPRNAYQRDEWQEIFAYAESNDIPVLWHVVNRVNYAAYHGGMLHSFWKQGWANGVAFTNKDLLEDALVLLRRFPKLKVIGAHELHLGIDRLDELFRDFENLYIEGSCVMNLRWADDFSDEVRTLLRDFIEKWSERILFGTDTMLFPSANCIDEYNVQSYLNHPRFMLKLWLNDDALQNVAWRNAYKLFKLKPGLWARRGNIRP